MCSSPKTTPSRGLGSPCSAAKPAGSPLETEFQVVVREVQNQPQLAAGDFCLGLSEAELRDRLAIHLGQILQSKHDTSRERFGVSPSSVKADSASPSGYHFEKVALSAHLVGLWETQKRQGAGICCRLSCRAR
jgi:hypothetical protein